MTQQFTYLVTYNARPLIYILQNNRFITFWMWDTKNGAYNKKLELGRDF